MKPTRFAAVAILLVASAGAVHGLWVGQAGNPPANENREEQSKI